MNSIQKSKSIKIQNIKETTNNNEFHLKTNCFDPTKFSPPNEFLIKLNLRMDAYNNLTSRFSE